MSYGKAGALYEQKINALLKKDRLQRPSFTHQPFNNDQPDSMFIKNKKEYGIEVKHVFDTSYGSYTIKHNGKRWMLAEPKPGNELFYKMLKASRIEDGINSFYNSFKLGVPFLFTEKNVTPQQRASDIKNFGGKTKNFVIGSNVVENYYSSKGVNYIQIQKLGFYYLKNNPAEINCPKFKVSGLVAELRLKPEVKKDGRQYHRFVIQVKPSGSKPAKSNVDLDVTRTFLK